MEPWRESAPSGAYEHWRAEISLTSGRWRCGAFSQRIREFLRGFARFRQRKDRSGKKFSPPASILQGWGSYYTFQIQRKPPTKQNHERSKDMFGLTALVITLIGTTVVGCGTGFAIVCATESWETANHEKVRERKEKVNWKTKFQLPCLTDWNLLLQGWGMEVISPNIPEWYWYQP